VARKNSELYDETSGPVWQRAVYEPVHDGWEFINLGGQRLLDTIAQCINLGTGHEVLEMCSGLGATCRYLAERYGCKVTGIEMNPRQVEGARARLSEVAPHVAQRICIIENNVLDWRASRRYDAVISLDSLMLIANLPRVIENSYHSLRPGGLLQVATIVAESSLDDDLRKFAWEMDGMISLSTVEEYQEILQAAGFVEIEFRDFTHLAIESSLKIAAALERNKDEIVRAQGETVYQGWFDVGSVYLSAFREGKLGYQLIAGRRGVGKTIKSSSTG
jgi:sarcosine/dimethylglycine N-methyltransferase